MLQDVWSNFNLHLELSHPQDDSATGELHRIYKYNTKYLTKTKKMKHTKHLENSELKKIK